MLPGDTLPLRKVIHAPGHSTPPKGNPVLPEQAAAPRSPGRSRGEAALAATTSTAAVPQTEAQRDGSTSNASLVLHPSQGRQKICHMRSSLLEHGFY